MMFVLLLAASLMPDTPTPADVLIDQLENQQEWSEADRLRAVDLAKLKGAAWRSCLDLAEQQLQRSKEPVETVATAILGTCLTPQRAYQKAYAVALRGLADPTERTAQALRSVEAARSSAREAIISRLVASRLPPQSAKPGS